MREDDFLLDDLPPAEGEKKKKKDPKLDFLLLQVTACAVLLLAALIIKLAGGSFYAEAREKYIELFEDETSLSEVMETMTGVFQMTPADGASDPAGTSETSAPASLPADSSLPAAGEDSSVASGGEAGDAASGEEEGTTSAPASAPAAGEDTTTSGGTVQTDTPPVAEGSSTARLKQGEEEDDVTNYLFDLGQVQTALKSPGSSGNQLLAPVSGTVSSRFGYRIHPITGKYSMHGGLDLAADEGTEIQASMDGVVKTVAQSDSYGMYVVINHQNGFETWYAHCSKLLAEEGETVRQGDVIALVGQTGYATGPHCHFEVRVQGCKLNPEWLLKLPEAA